MNYNHPQRNSSTLSIRLMCAIVFCLFSFCFLYLFQSDILAAAQHALSNGLTSYKPLTGAIIITLVLQILQLLLGSGLFNDDQRQTLNGLLNDVQKVKRK